jgi:arylsulfatase A-like enzyme
MLESVDQGIGRLRAKLKQSGVERDTIIIVTSDNGGVVHPRITDNSPLRAGKGHLYEGGIREPLIVHWPGVTKPGTVFDVPVSSIDYMPTLLEMAGGSAPQGIDGVSFAGLLKGGTAFRRDALYWHYPHYSPQGGVPSAAIRQGDWKLIEFFEDRRVELYNLRDDIGEQRNLSRKQPKKAAELKALLKRWQKDVGAQLPQPNPNYDASKSATGGRQAPTPPAL